MYYIIGLLEGGLEDQDSELDLTYISCVMAYAVQLVMCHSSIMLNLLTSNWKPHNTQI